MKTFIGEYKEFGYEGEKLSDNFEKQPYKGQERIANFLRKGGENYLCSTAIAVDRITGKRIAEPLETRQDEEYMWVSVLAYYVEKYNFRLPKEFEEHILNS